MTRLLVSQTIPIVAAAMLPLVALMSLHSQTGDPMNVGPDSSMTPAPDSGAATADSVIRTDAEWKQLLTAEQFRVLRQKGTEPPYSGEYYRNREEGVYLCAACGQKLFGSETKYESGCGWPSFWAPLDSSTVDTAADQSHGMVRTEITCSRCGGHLGHVFPDGPEPTGLRYCVNSASLKFEKKHHD